MCGLCGCGNEGHTHNGHGHTHDGHGHTHDGHGHAHEGHGHDAHRARVIAVETDILSKNRQQAALNRALFAKARVTALNVLSGPGSGKTTMLVRLLSMLKGRCPLAVVEADQHTALDAQRVRETGVLALQINTGKGCHLDAHQLAGALKTLPLPREGLLFVENVGNLVCPAAFDLGETARLVLLSLTEGEDKPLKYADAFATADAVVLSKADLAPHLDTSPEAFKANLHKSCPKAPVFVVSSKTGEGLDALLGWLWELRATQLAPEGPG